MQTVNKCEQAKYSNLRRTYTISFDAKSEGGIINFSHTIEAVDASQAVGSAINACRKHHIGVSVDLESIVVNCKNW